MYKLAWGLVKKILGVLLIIAGVISGFIPILQGWILILAGLLLLGVKKETIQKWAKKFRGWVKKKK